MTDTRRARRRVFLGGYVNDTNAQNLNCRALARYLDPTRYEVGCLSVYSGDLDTPDSSDHVFQSNWPNRLTAPLAYVRGLLWSDIAYLPHRRFLSILQPLARLLRRPLFTTVEGLLDGPNIASGVAVFGSRATLLESYRGFSACYAITRAVAEYKRQHLGISTDPDHLLQLGVDHAVHSKPTDPKRGLQSVLFVGRLIERKGIFEVIELARRRPGLSVHIAGDGEAVQMVAAAARSLPNLRVHGLLPQNQIADLMGDVDLLLLPSRSEGFLRVVLEASLRGCAIDTLSGLWRG